MHPSTGFEPTHGGDFEFSFRPDYGARVFVRLPQATLDVFRRACGGTESTLSLMVKHDRAIRALAIGKSRQAQTDRVVVTEADAESILAAGSAGIAAGPEVRH
jgi:hypothetical protein